MYILFKRKQFLVKKTAKKITLKHYGGLKILQNLLQIKFAVAHNKNCFFFFFLISEGEFLVTKFEFGGSYGMSFEEDR
jgi:hypothetical protein